MKMLLPLILLAILAVPSFAEELDPASREALRRTTEMLTDPILREQAIHETGDNAKFIDHHVKSLAGSDANAQEIYALSAEIMESITMESGGDVTKMMQILQSAKSDPQAFANRLSPAQREKLKTISRKIEPKAKETDPKAKP